MWAPRRARALLGAVLAQRAELGGQHGQFGLCGGQVHIALGVAQGFLRGLLGGVGFLFVEVRATDGGVGQHGHAVGLHFQNATGHEDEFLATVGRLDAN